MMTSQIETTLFRSISQESLNLISNFNNEKQNTFLMPTRFISTEAGQVGYLLSEYFNYKRQHRTNYRTFFANSRYEALQISIKIARHHSFNKQSLIKRILLCDASETSKHFIDPLSMGLKKAFIPEVEIVNSLSSVEEKLSNQNNYLALIIRDNQTISVNKLAGLFSICKKNKIFTVLEQSNLDANKPLSLLHKLPTLPDIVISGESLTDYEIPYAGVSMTEEVHQPWASMQSCIMHSSTYAANKLALTKVRDKLLNSFNPFKDDNKIKQQCNKIECSDKERLKTFAKYINPGLVELYKLSNLDLNPSQAHGSQLTVANTKQQIIDCVSGGGATVRGHTPTDIVNDVIQNHDQNHDYWTKLENKLKKLTNLPHCFPAISGATAVDIAISLSLLANNKRKVVTFDENYAGKTLLSLIATADPIWRTAFYPLYEDVIYINPFADDAAEKLTTTLTAGDVALIWFELIQGATAKHIPDELLDIINKNKNQYKYVIGIDEILMGSWRSGKKFTYQDKNIKPDIITLSKALSDGSFPMGLTVVSDHILTQASNTNESAVNCYANLYKNQFGAHIALHCIEKIFTSDKIAINVKKITNILNHGLEKLASKSPLLKGTANVGLFYKLDYNVHKKITDMFNGYGDFLFKLFICKLCLEKNHFIFFDRLIPALTLNEDDANELLQSLNKVFKKPKVYIYFRYTLFLLKMFLNRFRRNT